MNEHVARTAPASGWSAWGARRPDRWRCFGLAVVAVASVVALLVATRHGIGVSPDGVTYLRLADAFASDGSLYLSDASSPTHFPPGWPLFVGFGSLVSGSSVEAVALIVQGLGVLALYFAAARSLAGPGRPVRWLHVAGALFVGLTYPLVWSSTFALTDTWFLVLAACAIIALERFEMEGEVRFLAMAAILASLATSVRYVGVTLLVPIGVAVLCSSDSLRVRGQRLCAATAIVIGPIGLWAMSAPAAIEDPVHLTSRGTAGLDDAWLSFRQLGLAAVHWDIPRLATIWGLIGLGMLLVFLIAFGAVAAAGLRRPLSSVSAWVGSSGLRPWALFGGAYVALVAGQRWWIDREIIERYWPPFVLVTLVIAVRGAERWRRAEPVLLVVLVLMTMVNVAKAAEHVTDGAADGLGYNARHFSGAEAIRRIEEFDGPVVLTDSPALVTYFVPSAAPQDIMVDRVRDMECDEIDLAALTGERPLMIALFGRCNQDGPVSRIVNDLPDAKVFTDAISEATLITQD